MALLTKTANRTFARNKRVKIMVQKIAEQFERFQRDTAIALAVHDNYSEHQGAGLLLCIGRPHGNGMGAYDVFLQLAGIFWADGELNVITEASSHTVIDAAFLQIAVYPRAAALYCKAHILGEANLCAVANHGHKVV